MTDDDPDVRTWLQLGLWLGFAIIAASALVHGDLRTEMVVTGAVMMLASGLGLGAKPRH